MRISELSRLTDTPVSTIRAYENWTFISPAKRLENGYRVISLQVVYASAARNRQLCEQATRAYLEAVTQEKENAMSVIEKINQDMDSFKVKSQVAENNNIQYTAEQAADMIYATKGSIRNWERNGLIH